MLLCTINKSPALLEKAGVGLPGAPSLMASYHNKMSTLLGIMSPPARASRAKFHEKLIMRKLEGEWIMKKEMRMIPKDGTISEFLGYTSSKEEEEEEDEEEEEEGEEE
ncbi:hypothetical protein Tco_0825371 [Tanacetum coccineum]